MASSATGERRWGSARRSGMTVLGKVAVPKPINLPSQRLENHGLDPNVEIVPKGSLSWGARSSPPGSNAWGSSSVLSPRTEGGSASSSHLSGRPSSSGGTRPSTAGSERNPETTSNAWMANSRPSSASGILASNNTSLAALRPRSAETRPGSSHLSRFAEPLSEGTAAQSAVGAGDKLGMTVPSSDGFALSSGDFPTLGSEKVYGKNMESLDCNLHDRSGSSGPSVTAGKMEAAPGDEIVQPTEAKRNMANSRENDVPHSGMERWHVDSYPYPNHSVPPPPYETWHGGPPVNRPGAVWFRGPPGTPYGTPPMAAPGGFRMESFPYCCPQVPAPVLANSQTVPPHGARPSGPQSKNGDLCRPYVEPYMRPGMPIRPGFYPGYYGQPMGFCSPNERDLPLMGMPSGPPVFNQYPNQNALEPIISNSRSYGGRTLEKVDSGPLLDSRASVPVKQIKVWDKNSKEDHFDHKLTANTHPYGKGHASNASSEDKFWSEDSRKNKQTNWGKSSLHGQQASSFVINNKTGSTDPSFVKFDGHIETAESADVNHVVENATLPRDRTLIQKIEGLNAKARVSDAKHDLYSEEPDSRHTVSTNVSINQSGANVRLERHYPSGVLVPVSRDKSILDEDKGFGSTVSSGVTTISRHSSSKVQGRGDHGSKGRLNSQEADVWRKRSATSESRGIVPVVSSERTTNIQRKEKLFTEMSSSDGEAKDNSKLSMVDPHVTQHAEMREITKQRAIQLQKEEEERIREQKAKAFAKLEELNRRSANQGKETSSQTLNDVPSHTDPSPTDVVQKPQESKIKFELQFGSFQSGEIGSALASGSDPSKTGQDLHQEDPLLSQKQPLPAVEDTQINDVSGHQNVKVRESSRQKGAGHKQKHDVQSGNNFTDKPIVDGKDKSIISNAVSGSALHHKRRNNRAGKNKHMVDEISSASVHEELDASRPVAESLKRAITQKSHNNDAVVWAPVKAHTKMEVTDENDKKADEDAGPANGSNNPVPSSSKGRRAEIERYVPKAAIKVLAQQGSDQLSTPPIEKSIPDGTSIQGQTKRPVESRHVENKTKQIQTHGSWRQRIPAEPNFVQVSGDSSMTGSTKNSQTSDIAHQSQKPKELLKYSVAKQDEQCGKQQPQEVNEDIAVDGWVIYDEPISSSAIVSGVEGHVKSNRGRNNPFKGHKGSRNQNIDRESHTSAKGDGEYFSEANQTERPRSSKEHRVGQWQPKPQTHVTNHHGNHARGRQTVSDEGDKFFKREVSKDTRMVNMGSRESKDILEDRDNSPNEDSVGDVESAPLGQTDGTNNEQRPSSSGNRWNGSFHGRFNRGREFRGDRSFISQDNRHNYVPSNREKQRQNSRYEYQPVGPQNRNKREINSEGQTENQHAGAKFRDRGQVSHTQRGYGWQRVANQTDAGSE